jgi:CubicO group peptidase (beta-lactamase class C family)
MQLIERGKLNLDENGNTYLDFQIPDTTISPQTGVEMQ